VIWIRQPRRAESLDAQKPAEGAGLMPAQSRGNV
jgi:hypothetical protein